MSVRLTISVLLVVLLLLAATLVASPAHAAEALDWSEPQPVAEELATSWFPEIAVDPSGTFWMVWSGNLTGENANETGAINGAVMISKLTPDGWTSATDLYVMFGGIASRPMLAIDDTYIHLLFRTGEEGAGEKHFYMRAPLAADPTDLHVWSDPVPIAGGQSYWSDIKTLPDGTLLVTYNQRITVATDAGPEQKTELYSRRSLDQGQTWEPPVRISAGAGLVARNTLTVSPLDGTVTVAWDVGYDNMTGKGEPGGIYTAVSTDSGASWSTPQRLDPPEAGVESQAAAGTVVQNMIANNGEIIVMVYRSTAKDLLYYRTSADNGLTWQPEVRIPDAIPRPYSSNHQFDKYGLSVDSAGNFIFTYVSTDPDAPQGLSVMSMTFDERGWSEPELIGSPDGYPEYARTAIALGNQLQVVYFVRDAQFSDSGHYVLWTATAHSDAPATAPLAIQPAPQPEDTVPSNVVSREKVEIEPFPTPPPPGDPLDVIGHPPAPQSVINSPIVKILAGTIAALGAVLLVVGLSRVARQHRI